MSRSSLWGIDNRYIGEELIEYKNSWLFTPIVVQVVSEKYASEMLKTPYGLRQVITSLEFNQIWNTVNERVNHCDNTSDRICWEMSNQQIFFTKDKKCIADAIRIFVKNNTQYDISEKDGISSLCREHIIERFLEIANDIESLDEDKFPYFVFKNTSCDDSVEWWFFGYNEDTDEEEIRSLKDHNKFITEFVVIEDGKIKGFKSNLDFNYEDDENESVQG